MKGSASRVVFNTCILVDLLLNRLSVLMLSLQVYAQEYLYFLRSTMQPSASKHVNRVLKFVKYAGDFT